MNKLEESLLKQVDAALAEYERAIGPLDAYAQDGQDNPISLTEELFTMLLSTIRRCSAKSSIYANRAQIVMSDDAFHEWKVDQLAGIVRALRKDLASGFTESFQELVRGELFDDFLEMAEHLLGEEYKDAAAVIIGASLETHLKKMCLKNDIAIDETTLNGKTRTKKADTLNAELAQKEIYLKLDQKYITAWLGLRNSAAHGDYGKYTKEQVQLMLNGVREFIARFPS